MIRDFAAGTTILVDKPFEWTSFDVVNKLRWHLKRKIGVKKIKVGHAGTLDPLATGLLVICIGKHTKSINDFIQDDKVYTGKFLLGKTTPSYDLETEFNTEFDVEHISSELIEQVTTSFLGEQMQVPPIFSAKQVDGKRAYEHARKGTVIEMKPNPVKINSFSTEISDFPEIKFEVECSKGTYIRSLAHDFGQKLGSGATLIELRRTKSGGFSVDEARSVEQWIDFIENSPL